MSLRRRSGSKDGSSVKSLFSRPLCVSGSQRTALRVTYGNSKSLKVSSSSRFALCAERKKPSRCHRDAVIGRGAFGGTLYSASDFHKRYAMASVKRHSCWSFALHLWEETIRSLRLRTAIPIEENQTVRTPERLPQRTRR